MTTMRNIEQTTRSYSGSDQTIESSNQQSLEKEFHDDTTKLGDLAMVLNELQKASVRSRNVTRFTQNIRRKGFE